MKTLAVILILLATLALAGYDKANWTDSAGFVMGEYAEDVTDYSQDANILAYFRMDDDGTNEVDDGPSGNDFTQVNSPPTTNDYPSGYSGTSRKVGDVDDQFLYNGIMDGLTGAVSFTIAFWIKPIQDITEQGMFGPSGGANHISLWFAAADDKLELRVYDAGGLNELRSTATLSSNTWTHIACVGDSGQLYLYMDGVDVSASTVNYTAITAPTGEWCIGRANNFFIDYHVDDWAAWDRALSESEVNGVMNNGVDGNKGASDGT